MAIPPRIVKETQALLRDPVEGIQAVPSEHNPRHFLVVINGPGGTPFENGKFQLELFLPEEYPMTPPKVLFKTKIFHPNIDKLGRICLSILKQEGKEGAWSPALMIRSVLLSIQALLASPNLDDPLDEEIANFYKADGKAAAAKAKEWTTNFAK